MAPPLVSLIMPTRGRPELASIALAHALAQDYPSIEILIFDDTDLPSFTDPPQTPTHPVVRYYRNPASMFSSLGDKRNAMCEDAHGDLIGHVDSDDLSAPNRISFQVSQLTALGGDISGFHTLPFYDISTGHAYVYHLNTACVCGTSLVYRRDFWLGHPFPPINIGEDLSYTSAHRERRISSDGRQLLVALLHDGNMSSHNQVRCHPVCFPTISADKLPGWFRATLTENLWPTPPECVNVPEISTLLSGDIL